MIGWVGVVEIGIVGVGMVERGVSEIFEVFEIGAGGVAREFVGWVGGFVDSSSLLLNVMIYILLYRLDFLDV